MIKKFLNVWAGSGDTGTEPTITKQNTGFVRREKPNRQLFNWLFNRIQYAVDNTASHLDTHYDQSPYMEEAISKCYFEDSWGNGTDPQNVIDAGSGFTIERIHTFFIDSIPHLLMLDTASDRILVYNARTRALVETSADLSASITGTTVSMLDFCTDGDFVYVLFDADSSSVAGKFSIGGSWDYSPAWPSGGRSVPTTGSASFGNPRITVAYGDYLAITCPNTTITASNTVAIYVLAQDDGSVYASGAGDAPTGANLYADGPAASYGQYLFFNAKYTGVSYLCSLNLFAPTSGCGGTGYPASLSTPMVNVAVGRNIISVIDDDTPSPTDPIIHYSNPSNANLNNVLAGEPAGSAGYYQQFSGVSEAVTDGQYIWIGTCVETSTPNKLNAVVGVDVAYFNNGPRSDPFELDQIKRGPYFLPSAPESGRNGCRLCYDGRDMWTYTGGRYIYRIPRISHR